MATRDTAQLILEVDARIATAQRDVNRLARSIQQDAAGIDGSFKKIEQSSERIGRSLGSISGRTRSGFTQLSFQIGDVTQQMALGVSASRIFAQQSGQVIQALQIMGGEGNKFLRFLGGPWGLALTTGAVILGTLGSKLFETGDEVGKLVEKMREQAKQARDTTTANEIYARSLDGIEDGLRKVGKFLDELQDKGKSQIQLTLQQTETLLAQADAYRIHAQAVLDDAKARLAAEQQFARGPSQGSEVAALGLNRFQGVVDQAQAELNRTQAAIANGRKYLSQLQSYRAVEEASLSKADEINRRYDALVERTRKRLVGHTEELKKQVKLLEKKRQLELDATKETNKGSGQSGRQVDFAGAAAIARAAGLQVNSAYRSPAKQAALFNDPSVNRPGNPVAPPGASAHNGANGRWAIDIQITDGLTPQKIRKIYADQGVSLSKVLKEKGHFHIEGSRSEAAKAENDQQRQADQQVRRDNAFAEAKDRLNQELLQAQGALLQGINEQADFAEDAVRAEQQRRDNAIQNDVTEGKLTQAQADQLKAINASNAAERSKAIEIGRQVDLLQQQDEDQQRTFQYRIDDLRFADEMATTQAEHRRVQLEILDVIYQQKEAHLKALKAELELAGKIEEAADIQSQIDRLPTEKAQDRTRTTNGTMDPLEAWARSVPKTADQINEALQSIEARGLDNLSDAITQVIMGTESLGEAFSNIARSIIADIIQMTIRMLIFRAISGVIGGSPAPTQGFTGPPSAKGNVFSLGNIVPHRLGGVVNRLSYFPMSGGKMGSMAEDGPEAVMPLARDPSGRLGVRALSAANSNRTIELVVYTAPSPDAWAQVEAVSTSQAVKVVTRAAPALVRTAANATMRAAKRPALMGRR